jgi:hypothetical protein
MLPKIVCMKLLVIILATVMVIPALCYGDRHDKAEEKTTYAYGIINRKPKWHTYNYGTHVLRDQDANKLYALRNVRFDLDQFVHQKVIIKGTLVTGYPLEGGPDYLDVESVNGN